MPIALESSSSSSNSNQIGRSGFRRGMFCGSVCDSPESRRAIAGDRRLAVFNTAAMATKNVVEEREEEVESSSSSSIGRNSDSSDGEGDSGEAEVQSSCKGPLDCLDALGEVLPIKRGMSKFYSGKSKSFTSLGDAATCSSIEEIVKPEDAYSRKRKNLLAHRTFWDKNCNYPPRSNSGGVWKRPANSSRSTLSLAAMSSFETNNYSDNSNSNSPPPALCRPPLYPDTKRSDNNESSSSSPPPTRNFSPWRSFSLSDLQCAAAAATTPSIAAVNLD